MINPQEKEMMMEEVVKVIKDGNVELNITGRYELSDISQAHTDLESRLTTGALVVAFNSKL